MPRGFFHESELLAMRGKPVQMAPRCEICRLYKTCISPKMPVTGEGRLGVLVVAEAPGAKEDERNTQLVGKAGQKLRQILKRIDVDLDRDCWKTNSLICRPPHNRTPTDEEMGHCRPHLVETIEKYQPHCIIPLGEIALKQVIGPYWNEEFGGIGRWAGFRIPLQPLNTWVCPTWHPSYLEREKNEVLDLWFERHLEEALKLTRRPWKEAPDYKSHVEQLTEASDVLDSMVDYEGMAAIDYETNMLKPDNERGVIVSASVTWGRAKPERCIAYPMTPSNVEATRRFLRSPIPKIAANLIFEERWSMCKLGTRVRNWTFDTMQAAHNLDNRPGVTGLDFVAFTQLGLPTYSSHIKPLLKAKGATVNQILEEISLRQLLEYNGLDTWTEFEIAVSQMKRLGMAPPWKEKR